jgi:hypothetical protein
MSHLAAAALGGRDNKGSLLDLNDLFLYFALAAGLVAAPILLFLGLVGVARRSRKSDAGRKGR